MCFQLVIVRCVPETTCGHFVFSGAPNLKVKISILDNVIIALIFLSAALAAGYYLHMFFRKVIQCITVANLS